MARISLVDRRHGRFRVSRPMFGWLFRSAMYGCLVWILFVWIWAVIQQGEDGRVVVEELRIPQKSAALLSENEASTTRTTTIKTSAKKKSDKQQQQQQRLWLVTCETRTTTEGDNKNAASDFWLFSARHVQLEQQKKQQRKQQQQQDDDHVVSDVVVEVSNVCANQTWRGTMLHKFYSMQSFVSSLIQSGHESDAVLFSDADSIFNPWGVSATQVLQRFQNLTNQKRTSTTTHRWKNEPNPVIVVSAEPNFYLGTYNKTQKEDLQLFYPDTKRSSCPQFLNSGQYMGTARALSNVYEGVFAMSDEIIKGNPKSDQGRLNNWYIQNKHLVVLDVESTLFRTLMYGYIDAFSKPKYFKWSCGADAHQSCGQFSKKPYWLKSSITTTTTGQKQQPPILQFKGVPECPTEPIPFSIHAAG